MSATLTLLHLSDTHFGSESPAVADALLRLSEQQQPTMAILSGDITQRGKVLPIGWVKDNAVVRAGKHHRPVQLDRRGRRAGLQASARGAPPGKAPEL